MIVTIDGPAGSGKSTTARAVADQLGYVYLDTGAMYRAVALAFLRRDADPTPEDARDVLPDVTVDVRYRGDEMVIYLNGDDVTDAIRTAEVGTMASEISALSAVREKLLHEQQRIGEERNDTDGGVVLDGRDTGTVVFPDADVKIFMVADPRERARRRLKEYESQGDAPSLDAVQREIESRDRKDRNRDIAPLKKADDAVELDTTGCTIDDQVRFVIDRIRAEHP